MSNDALAGRYVLIVEDDYHLADDIRRALRSVGALVLGPTPRVRSALDMLGEWMPDVAVLDVELGEERSFPVADALLDHGVPFVFAFGCDRDVIPGRLKAVRRLTKPVDMPGLFRELRILLGQAVPGRARP